MTTVAVVIKNVAVTVLALAAIVGLSACERSGETGPSSSSILRSTSLASEQTPTTASVVFALTLDTTVVGDTVHVSGTLNGMPNGTKLSVGLQRTIIDPEMNEPGYFDVDYASVTLRDGRYEYDLVDNRKKDARDFVDVYNSGEPPGEIVKTCGSGCFRRPPFRCARHRLKAVAVG